MSLLSGLMGHHSEVDLTELQEEFSKILVEGERIDQAFRLLRDLVVFTSKRIIHVDRLSGDMQNPAGGDMRNPATPG